MTINSIHTNRILLNHQYQYQSNNCGPLCAAMVINTIKGLRIDGFVIADAMNHQTNNNWLALIPRIPNSATFPWGIVSALAGYGITSNWRSFTPFASLTNLISKKYLIIVLTASYQPVSAHYRILVSIAPDYLGFVDPAYPQENLQFQPVDSFISSWHRAVDTIIMIPNQ